MEDFMQVVKDNARVKVPIGACRFFASVAAIQSEDDAKMFIETISSEFRDATHNAWGYKLAGSPEIVRYSDDREPSGTAGPPIIQAIDSAEVSNVVVVVTRFFGGVKLGVGGLIRAYRQTATEGLAAAGSIEVPILREILISGLGYNVLGTVLHELESCKATVKAVEHGQLVAVRAAIFPRTVDSIRARVTDLTRGQGEVNFVS